VPTFTESTLNAALRHRLDRAAGEKFLDGSRVDLGLHGHRSQFSCREGRRSLLCCHRARSMESRAARMTGQPVQLFQRDRSRQERMVLSLGMGVILRSARSVRKASANPGGGGGAGFEAWAILRHRAICWSESSKNLSLI